MPRRTIPRQDVKTILLMVVLLALPAYCTFKSIDGEAGTKHMDTEPPPRSWVTWNEESSPHGYTWSLLLFALPVAALSLRLFRAPKNPIVPRALWRSRSATVSAG